MKTVSVVIPVYYNAESLAPLFVELQKVEAQLRERDCAMELILVDDGSGDDSMAEMMKIKQQRPATRVVKLTRNFGEVHAYKVGLRHATGDCVTWLNADLQDPPSLVTAMTDKWLAGAKFVIALRESRTDPPLTTLFATMYHWLVRKVISPDYPRGGVDIVLMDATVVPYVRDSSKNVNTALLTFSLGFAPAVVPYERQQREHGQSRWTFAKKLTHFLNSILGFSILPVRAISVTGMAVTFAAFCYAVLTGVWAAVDHHEAAMWHVLFAVVVFLLGVIIVILGLIGEYVWRILDEVSRAPEAVVDEVY